MGIREAEAAGLIKPGDTLIEPTSGNTGVGICMAGAVLGYRVIICLPKKMFGEKVNTMKRLGATILRTPTEAAWNAPDSHITLSARLMKAIPNSYVLDQYKNKGNPLAHYEGTAEEIIEQTGGDFTHIVMSAGTRGTLTGTAKKIKEKLPHVKVVGIDPVGSILAKPNVFNFWLDLVTNGNHTIVGLKKVIAVVGFDQQAAGSTFRADTPVNLIPFSSPPM